MKNSSIILTVLLTFVVAFSCNRGTVTYGEGGAVISGKGKAKCKKPNKPYTKEMDLSVKATVDSLGTIPSADLDSKLKTTVVKLTDYSTQGLDRDLLLFRICEMSINRGLTNEQTTSLINTAMGIWESELKKKN